MAMLVLRNVPDDLYQRLKETAVAHHRSMNQEAIVVLKGALVREAGVTPKPTWEEFAGQVKDLWAMPVLDHRAPDEIIGYDDHGLPG
jgi:antitoxin VapB